MGLVNLIKSAIANHQESQVTRTFIIDTDENGNTEFTFETLPSDYRSKEWKAYNKACDKAIAETGRLGTTEEERTTYSAYRAAMQARVNKG